MVRGMDIPVAVRPARRPGPDHVGTVLDVRRLTPQLVRVVFGGDGLRAYAQNDGWTDTYVNLLFVPEDAPYAVPFDPDEARTLDRALWPAPRRYTVRRWVPERAELWVDFVVHGDTGVAGRWAQRARPGDRLQFRGPSGGYRPDPAATHVLMVGDESALPAIAASLEQVPAGATAFLVGLVEDGDGELELECPGRLETTWVHRQAVAGEPAHALVAAVDAYDFPAAGLSAFVHGEAVETRAVRRHLLGQRGVPREALSVSPYWRRTFTDERWREVKRDWLADVERDV